MRILYFKETERLMVKFIEVTITYAKMTPSSDTSSTDSPLTTTV
jgi:hypothetical protein